MRVEGEITGIRKIIGAIVLIILVAEATFTYLSHGLVGHEATPRVRKIHKPVVKQNINAPVQPRSVLDKEIDQQVKATGRSGTLLVVKAGKTFSIRDMVWRIIRLTGQRQRNLCMGLRHSRRI